MSALLLALLTAPSGMLPAAAPDKVVPVDTLFVKVGPNSLVPGRSPKQNRAVVLLHGLSLHPFSKEKPTKARLRTWQKADSDLVRLLSRSADVYAFAYAQTVPCERICPESPLVQHVRNLTKAGYREIVLVGHSAGGLIARQFVEDHPTAGVTKVVQVCSPNAGSLWAALKTARSVQIAFLTSLTRSAREQVLTRRVNKMIPASCQFACIVGSIRIGGDGIVPTRSQWSTDLQKQGIPAFPVRIAHWDAMKTERTIELIAQLVQKPLPRWNAASVAEVRRELFGD